MSIAMLIGFWVHDELSFNRYHPNYHRIAQLMKCGVEEDGTPWAGGFSLAFPLIDELKTRYGSNFKHLVEALQPGEVVLTANQQKISAQGQYMAAGAAEMLSLEMISGKRSGLKDPKSILLAESTARSLFGNVDPLGETLKINTDIDVTVTGVFRDLPMNTRFHYLKFIAPFDLALMHEDWIRGQDWMNHFLHIYCEIPDESSYAEVRHNIENALARAIKNIEGLDHLKNQRPRIELVPMKDWHLRSSFSRPNYGKPDEGPARFVLLVGIIGAFVLLLACINFMNLSTARSEKRAREVGIRKSMGSFRRQLIGQFFAESYVVVLLAFASAILLTTLALPAFNQLAAKDVTIPWSEPMFWIIVTGFVLITGLLAGSYPALYLSSFNPVKTLKGTFKTGRRASVPRKVLVVIQFTVSVVLIISTVVVHNQIQYVKDRPVGYTREGLILIPKKNADFFGKTDILRSELKKTGMIDEISESGGAVTEIWSNNSGFTWQGKDPGFEENFGTLGVTAEYGSTLRWQFIAGRDFSPDIASDSSALVINESAARLIGTDGIIGKVVHWKNSNWRMDNDLRIIGVVKDMVMNSPYEHAKPTVFLLRSWNGWFNVRLRSGVHTADALKSVASVFLKVIPSAPFDYEFADAAYAAKFASEERIASLATVFAILAILISCLGLFGLASYVAEQRTKEIGIRKVVGASILNIWKMLSLDFVLLVLLSSIIAVPVTYTTLNAWLEQYEYRINISFWTFAFCITGAIVLTLATVSYQAIKAASICPAKTLKSE
jgi:ABC-type antimicrobial peptide transport system permease subunit